MKKNYLVHSFLVVLFAFVMVNAYSFIHPHIPYSSLPFIGDKFEFQNSPNLSGHLSGYFEEVEIDTTKTQVVTTVDTLTGDTVEIIVEKKPIYVYNLSSLMKFYASLKQTKNGSGKTRIAYFGDSMIEGDLITQTIREILQKEFGGSGVGFVPITSITANFRTTIRHSFSENWKSYSFVKGNSSGYLLGISGDVFVSPDSSEQHLSELTITYKGTGARHGTYQFPNAKLFYGAAKYPELAEPVVAVIAEEPDSTDVDSTDIEPVVAPPSVEIKKYINSVTALEKSYNLSGTNTVNSLSLASNTNKVDLSFKLLNNQPLYGLSFESGSGVILDNLASRGNSGMVLTQIRTKVLQQFSSQSGGYDLVVLHFGTNVINKNATNMDWYGSSMKKVIRHFNAALPNADILVISAMDKCTKIDGELTTDPSIPMIVETLKEAALEEEAAFIDLYTWMGGEKSMIDWADAEEPLANKDYTHVNFRGAEKVGAYIADTLMTGYNDYLITLENPTAEVDSTE